MEFLAEPYRTIYHAPALIKAEVERRRRQIRVKLSLETKVDRTCDDCLAEFKDDVKLETMRMFVIGGDELSEAVDVVTLAADAHELDLSQVIKEMILLNHPMKILCKPDCKGLCPGCGVNLNTEICQCKEESVDPRWAELKKLLK